MQTIHKLIIDLARPSRSNTIIVKKGDTRSRLLHFILLSNGESFDMSDVAIATVKGVKPDDSVIFADATIVTDEEGHNTNVVEYTLSDLAMTVAGQVRFEITLTSGTSEILSSFEFYVQVENLLYDENDMLSGSDLSGFRNYLMRALMAATKAESVREELEANMGNLENLIDGFRSMYLGYEYTLEDLDAKIASGAFIGAQGQPGEPGMNGVISSVESGYFGFSVVDGELVYHYWNTEALPISMNTEGELIITY